MLKLVGISIALLFTSTAGAYEEFTTWRINGGDIERVEMLPAVIRSPGIMRIIFKNSEQDHARHPLVIVSDDGIEECYKWARKSAHNRQLTLEITQWKTSKTLNGVIVTGCFAMEP
ncbi:MAG: hypothetical protein AAF940_11580 [Pseudomonadota bacterium]